MRPKAKHELFAQYLADGLSQAEAYIKAGFRPKDRNSADAAASRLVKTHPETVKRADELRAQKVEKDRHVREAAATEAAAEAKLTAQTFINNLLEIRDMGMQAKPVLDRKGNPTGEYQQNLPAAITAVRLLGQELFGQFVDKKEVRTGRLDDLTDEELLERAKAASEALGIPFPKNMRLQ